MNNLKTVVAFAVGSLFAGAAFAQSNYSIEQRDRIDQARIDRGVASGRLTSREADRLQDGRAQIERMESRARSDGTLTRYERARIDGAQDRLSRDIYRESHDRQTSNSYGRQDGNRGNGWGRGNERSNGWGRGNERGYEHGARGGHTGYENGARGQRNESHSNGWTPRAGTGTTTGTGNSHGWTPRAGTGTTTGTGNSHGWTPRTDATTPRTGTQPRTGQSDRSGGRQASMPQAQARSTLSTPRATGQVAVARQGGDSGRRTR